MKNHLIILLDSLRYDAYQGSTETGVLKELGLLGDFKTPNLNSIRENSARAPLMHAPWPGTPPTIASILTGLYPREHQVAASHSAINPRVPFLANIFREAGYYTLFWTDFSRLVKNVKAERFDEIGKGPMQMYVNRIEELNARGEKVFSFFHTDDTHGPYMMSKYPPSEDYHDRAIKAANRLAEKYDLDAGWTREEAIEVCEDEKPPFYADKSFPVWNFFRDTQVKTPDYVCDSDEMHKIQAELYVKGINHYDEHQLSVLRKFLFDSPSGRESSVVITADHGQTVRKMGEDYFSFYHSGRPGQDVIRIPAYFFRYEIDPQRLKKWPLTSSVDIFPTILARAGIEGPEVSGCNLFKKPPRNRQIFSEFSLRVASDGFPSPGVLLWNCIIHSSGIKYYRFGSSISKKDYEAPVREFLRRILVKTQFDVPSKEEIEITLEEMGGQDSRAIRRKIYRNLIARDGRDPIMVNWRNDHFENVNLMDSMDRQIKSLSRRMERVLSKRFKDPLDFQEPFLR